MKGKGQHAEDGRSSNNATNAKEEDAPSNQDVIEKRSRCTSTREGTPLPTKHQDQYTLWLLTLLYSDQWLVNYDLVSESES